MARGREPPKKKVPSLVNQPLTRSDERESSAGGKQGEFLIEMETEKPVEGTTKKKEEDPKIQHPTPKKLWVDVISGNMLPTNGMAIGFVAPNVVEGKDLSMNAVKQFMSRSWNHVKQPDIYYHDTGYFLLRFHSYDDRDTILASGPYSIYNSPMVLKEWVAYFDIKRDMMRTLPIWVKLPNLPLSLWGPKSLSKIGSALGTPLFTDECRTSKLRVSYARILVEMDITQKPKESIIIKDNERKHINQAVELEWKPKYCDECQQIGHQCTRK
ncbi:uncharacterized protein LOC131594992 [Vicia villosa]|uniref:uncharacterized protein LOC131594992 n=1 Tax=Vicia villosa TaxID=3911 RepID=UPI00273C04C1|nr:uncharacterized protein LOC131594992 [Vicia villosa]